MTGRALDTVSAFALGQKVVWLGPQWHYGYEDGDVPAEVVGFTDKRVKIEFSPAGEIDTRYAWVSPQSLYSLHD